jgi:hypothetical protein
MKETKKKRSCRQNKQTKRSITSERKKKRWKVGIKGNSKKQRNKHNEWLRRVWNEKPQSSIEVYRRFEGTNCLHLQGETLNQV